MTITLLYITLTVQIMLINVIYLDISVSNIHIIPRHGLFCVCLQSIRVCITIQHKLWLSEHAQNDPCKASKCNVVSCLFDSVISNECKSFKAIFVNPRSLHTCQLIWLETAYGHAGYHWESLHQSDGNKMHWDEIHMFQLIISIALNPIPKSNASGPCHAMTVTIITF